MKKILGFFIAFVLVLVVAAGLYIHSVWNPAIPLIIQRKVQQQAADHGGYTPISQIPTFLQNAVIDTEDHNFYHNRGFDITSLIRALIVDVSQGKFAQGGSTITQQLVKDILLSSEKTVQRKLTQIAIASMLSQSMPKSQILALYLNEVYFGQGAYGITQAAQVYFHRPVNQLTKAQCTLLAGLPQAPSAYDPITHFTLAKQRQRLVIESMVRAGFISFHEGQSLLSLPLYLVTS